VIAYHRWQDGGPGDDVVVVVNFGYKSFPSYSLGFPREGLWWVRFNSDSDSYSPDFGNFGGYPTTAGPTDPHDPDFMPCRGNIGIAPYSVLLLSQ
jgi:1,4-alpha-glucan branching enzyme